MTTYLGTETTVQLVPLTCGHKDCDAVFAFAQHMYDRLKENRQTWYCPNGHARVFTGRTREQQLEAQLEASRRIASNERERRALAERQRAAARGQVTKIKRRVGRGVCPCCNRTFADLARHMEGQHPEFATDTAPGVS